MKGWPARIAGSLSIAIGAFAMGFAVTDIAWSSIVLYSGGAALAALGISHLYDAPPVGAGRSEHI
ncbi:MAG TPA: hypothetical protein H9822_01260 [Candidatus Yaniella excrementavium]|nr:hypothetical protein [Candidatus Yaniella excrementavium]